jgi:hypothetical protein
VKITAPLAVEIRTAEAWFFHRQTDAKKRFFYWQRKIGQRQKTLFVRYDLLFIEKIRPDGDVKAEKSVYHRSKIYMKNFPFWACIVLWNAASRHIFRRKSNHGISDKGPVRFM